MRGIQALLAFATVVSLLAYSGPSRAQACDCAPLPTDIAGARRLLDGVQGMVIAEAAKIGTEEGADVTEVDVSTSYKGPAPNDRIKVRGGPGDCAYIVEETGTRHFFTLHGQADGSYPVDICSSFSIPAVLPRPQADFLAALVQVAPPRVAMRGQEEDEGQIRARERAAQASDDDDGTPAWLLPAAITSVLVVVGGGALALLARRLR